jgi:hypothetical protein
MPPTKKKGKAASNRNYVTFLRRIVKSTNAGVSCGTETLRELHDLVGFVLNELSDTANDVTKLYAKGARSTAKPKLIGTTLRLCLRGELRDRAVAGGLKKLTAFQQAKGRTSSSSLGDTTSEATTT